MLQGGLPVFTARYNGGGLRTGTVDLSTGVHDYSWGPGGIVHDSNANTTYTPGLAHRKNSGLPTASDRFYHSDWLGSTRYLSESSGNSFPNVTVHRDDSIGRECDSIPV